MKNQKSRGILLDLQSKTNESNESEISLYVKTKNGLEEFKEKKFKPYFFILFEGKFEELKKKLLEKNFGEEETAKIQKVEEAKKANAEKVAKLFFKNTTDLVKAREQIKEIKGVLDKREHDILFTKRYLIDKNLKPMNGVEIEFEEINGEKIIEKVKSIDSDFGIKLNLTAFDLETYSVAGEFCNAEKDPIIFASVVSEKEKTVITYGKKEKILNTIFLDEEKQLVHELVKRIKENHTDILVTYNGDLFDLPYLRQRAKILKEKIDIGFAGEEPKARKRGIGSAVKITGVQHLDAYQLVKWLERFGTISLTKFDLESVIETLFDEFKEKLKFYEINEIWKSRKGLNRLANYNLEDSMQTMRIAKQYLPIAAEFSKTVKQTLFEVIRESGGILAENMLIQKAFEKNLLIPNRPIESLVEERLRQTFKGGFVKSPEQGLHENIAVLDFRSLHPSIIVSHNISPETLNCSCCKNTKNVSPDGDWFCTKKTGFVAGAVKELLEYRSKIKAELKKMKPSEKGYATVFARQHALKILLNSFYGYLGYSRSRWYSLESARAITAWSRHYIRETIHLSEQAGFNAIYGDSITKDRFVTILNPKGLIEVKNIEQLFEENKTIPTERNGKQILKLKGFKALSFNIKTRKVEFKPIKEIIRHKAGKTIYRLNQKFGETIATEDHSLIVNNNGKIEECKPLDLKGKQLIALNKIPKTKEIKKIDLYDYLKSYCYETFYKNNVKISQVRKDDKFLWFGWTERKIQPKVKRFIKVESREFAAMCRLLGAFIAEGSSSTIETSKGKAGASIASSNVKWLMELGKDYHLLFENVKTQVIPSTKKMRKLTYAGKTIEYQDKTHKLQMMNEISAVFFKMLCGQKSNGKKLPNFIFNVSKKFKKSLLNKWIEGDGSRSVNKKLGYSKEYKQKNFSICTKSLAAISGLSLLLRQLGINYSIQFRKNKKVYTIKTSSKSNKKIETKIEKENYGGFVYDLSIEGNENFVDACGQILLHNTDSAFIVIPKNKSKKDVEAFVKKVNAKLPGVMELEIDGYYKRGIFVGRKEGGAAKKRYALIDENDKLKIVGFEYVRRDWAVIAKQTQRKVIEAILKEGKVEKAIEIVRKTIEDLKSGKVPKKDLIIMTQVKKPFSSYETTNPHISAAVKAVKKGKKIGVGSILEFIITRSGKSISDKAMLEEFVQEGNYDADYYIKNQVLPAVIKIMQELGLSEEDLMHGGKQQKLSSFSEQ